MNDRQYYCDYEKFRNMLVESERGFDMELIDKAYNFAYNAHKGQKRKSGVEYILHPVSVAEILFELGMDTESLVAALLHDVVEDTNVKLSDIKKEFSDSIANLIDGVTKIGQIPFSSREEEQAENIRKMLMAMADDIRVIIIKLADRLNNMRTIACMPDQKRRDKSLENMEVYVPIAHRLGITAVKEELEDISLKELDPIGYKEIEHALELNREKRQEFIEKTKKNVYKMVSEHIPNITIEGRVKSISGIYRKVFMQGKSLEEIYDVYAVRVIVETVNDCYNVLGIIHDIYRPLPNRFKDYISTPKPNLYQSLHTTVVGKEAIPFEIQIRTYQMHHMAEYGIAAHWKYKLGITKSSSFEKRLAWIRQMIENQSEDEDATDLLSNIKSDLGSEEVFVFTPKGDVITLPLGSTTIDFAYAIHTQVGHRMVGAKVDKKIVPINYKVKTGEIIEIITTKEISHGPSRDWLNFVKTSEAKNKIRQWFKRERRDENIIEGKNEIEKEFKRNNIELPEKEMQDFLKSIAKKQRCNTVDDLYASIGYGGIKLYKIISKIKEDYLKISKPHKVAKTSKDTIKVKRNKVSSGVIIDGLDDCLIKFSKCCNPLPGDDIIGFITRGYGVSIHKRTCTNVPSNIKKCDNAQRWIGAHWNYEVSDTFESTLEIVANDRNGLLADITSLLSMMHIPIHSMNSRSIKDERAILYITITVDGIDHLKSIISRLNDIKGIVSIKRS